MSTASTPQRSLLPLVVRGLGHSEGDLRLLDGIDLELGRIDGADPETGAEADPDAGVGVGAGSSRPGTGRGGCTAVMGPNGAGKSLLLRLLNGVVRPSAGEIRWNGAPPDDDVRRRQALVFQKPVLLRRSVRANVDFVLKLSPGRDRAARHARADRLLALGGLGDRARAPARRLSGGEQQRLALVCALASEPEVLLLDEPTASLDPASTAAIETLIADTVAAGTRVLLVTHDAGQARRLADSVVFMANGRVTEHTPAAAFFARPRSGEARDYLAGRLVSRDVRADDRPAARGAPSLEATGIRSASS